jgi:hypothetical protein
MIQVRMLTSVAGVLTYTVGEIVSLSDNVARAWIADGIAEVAPAPVEMAMAGAGVATRVRGRK